MVVYVFCPFNNILFANIHQEVLFEITTSVYKFRERIKDFLIKRMIMQPIKCVVVGDG